MIVNDILPYLTDLISSCVGWFEQIISAVGGKWVVLSAFFIVLVVSLLFVPLRGHSLVGVVNDFTMSPVNKTFAKKAYKRNKQIRKGG